MIITRRANDVKMRGKINAGLSSNLFTFFDNLSSLTVSFTIKEGVQDWFPRINVVKIVKDSHYVISLPIQFLREFFFVLILLSLATISAFPQSTSLWHSVVCRARPPSSFPIRFWADRVFPL